MKKANSYKAIKGNELRKELVSYITKRCGGMISKKTVKCFVQELSLSDLVNHSYELIITSNYENAANALTLLDSSLAHSWAGDQGILQEGEELMGDITFGENYSYEYFDNGTLTITDDYASIPNFRVDKVCAALISSHEWDHYDKAYWDKYEKKIVIYLPPKKIA